MPNKIAFFITRFKYFINMLKQFVCCYDSAISSVYFLCFNYRYRTLITCQSVEWKRSCKISMTSAVVKIPKCREFAYWTYLSCLAIHTTHVLIAFLTAARAYGMYDNEYQVIANDWITMHTSDSKPLCSCE